MSGTLPLRRWLALALVIAFVVPVFVTISIGAKIVFDTDDGLKVAVARLRDGASQWNDPAWQAETTAQLKARGIDVVLFEDGREVYRSAADPLAGTDATRPESGNPWAADDSARLARQLTLPGDAPRRTAHLYTPVDPRNADRAWLLPLAALTTLLVTLTGIAWVLGRSVVGPLAATSAAARQVAAGDLDVALPPSRVREVAEVNAAFEAMSAGLRASVEEQARLEQERRLFISAIAHDLRTPLFALRGYLAGLEQGIADTPERAARYVAVAQEKADALERLIADLFTYTRLEYLDQAPDRRPADLHPLLRRLAEGLGPQAEAKRVRLDLDLPHQPCVVEIDPHLIERAVENLLDNALRHTPVGGTISISCARDGDMVAFAVADDGPGIAPEDLPQIFAPLYRAESSRNRRTGGAGLGLTIARRILRAHGGDLSAANGERGAIFRGTLPVA